MARVLGETVLVRTRGCLVLAMYSFGSSSFLGWLRGFCLSRTDPADLIDESTIQKCLVIRDYDPKFWVWKNNIKITPSSVWFQLYSSKTLSLSLSFSFSLSLSFFSWDRSTWDRDLSCAKDCCGLAALWQGRSTWLIPKKGAHHLPNSNFHTKNCDCLEKSNKCLSNTRFPKLSS